METKPKTNADRIRAMTDDELAKLLSTGTFICDKVKDEWCAYDPDCYECRLAWLRTPLVQSGAGPRKNQKQNVSRHRRRNGGTVG